ncbi:MAG: primosomal protein N' [Rickettsiales bacterium]|nr:primosomal protein N' [Rickettsiales bacterium]
MSEIFVQVLLPLAPDDAFTYSSTIVVECGDVVRVEFGKKEIYGVVWQISKEAPQHLQVQKIKKILEVNPHLKLSKNQLKFIAAIASYNLASKGLVLRAFIGILNSDKVKKISTPKFQQVEKENFCLKKLLPKQQKIVNELQQKISDYNFSVNLLDGVTGSGKTEIYFLLIAQLLSQNNDAQILILLPEIALTSQLLLRFEEQFGFVPALWHSKISKKEKREIFYGVTQGSVKVLIGARSALLLPFKNLKLIIIDEEHDSSFKQEDIFNFHARDMAIVKAKLENFPVILSSATPALETYQNALLGKYNHFILEQSFGQKNVIELIDLRREKLSVDQFLSQKLCQEIAQNLAEKKQVLLFLNRRGYAPVTLCKACGKKYQCLNCDFNLVLHKAKKKLICHHCGHQENLISECKFCGEKDVLISVGVGVEKIAEEIKINFPAARIATMTSDNINNFVDADKLVKQILNHEVDIILGTQMIAKGHDFPDLNLVGIIDADSAFYSSELRALEKAYQILTQVIGRVGRRDKVGNVIIQTYNPENFIFGQIIKNNKKDFYDFELKNRQSLDLPPFSRMVKFEISAFLENDAKNFAKKLIKNFPVSTKIEIFGPAPAQLQRLKNRHHFLVNLKADKKINLQKLIIDVLQQIEIPKSVRLRIDVDVA